MRFWSSTIPIHSLYGHYILWVFIAIFIPVVMLIHCDACSVAQSCWTVTAVHSLPSLCLWGLFILLILAPCCVESSPCYNAAYLGPASEFCSRTGHLCTCVNLFQNALHTVLSEERLCAAPPTRVSVVSFRPISLERVETPPLVMSEFWRNPTCYDIKVLKLTTENWSPHLMCPSSCRTQCC